MSFPVLQSYSLTIAKHELGRVMTKQDYDCDLKDLNTVPDQYLFSILFTQLHGQFETTVITVTGSKLRAITEVEWVK